MIATNHLSDFAFDRLMSGELDGTDQQLDMRTHIVGCPACTERQSQLARSAQEFGELSAALTPLTARMLELTAGRHPISALASRVRAFGGAFIAVTAVAAAVLVLMRPPAARERDEHRIKGAPLKLEVYVRRTGGAVESLLPGSRVAPGDALRFGISAPFDGFLGIVSADAAGNVTSYLPGAPSALPSLPVGAGHLVDGSIDLDRVLGNERLVAFLCRERLDVGQLLATVRAALTSAHGDPKRMNIANAPVGCLSTTLWFEKVLRP